MNNRPHFSKKKKKTPIHTPHHTLTRLAFQERQGCSAAPRPATSASPPLPRLISVHRLSSPARSSTTTGMYLDSIPGASVDPECLNILARAMELRKIGFGFGRAEERIQGQDQETLYIGANRGLPYVDQQLTYALLNLTRLFRHEGHGDEQKRSRPQEYYKDALDQSLYSGIKSTSNVNKIDMVSYSGRMVHNEQKRSQPQACHLCAVVNDTSMNPAMISQPLTNINHRRYSAVHNQKITSNPEMLASEFLPLQENSNDVLRSFNDCTTPAGELPTLRRCGSTKIAPQPQRSLQYTVILSQHDVEEMYCRKSAVGVMPTVHKKGNKPKSEEVQLEKIFRLSIASLISNDGTRSAAGVPIRNDRTGDTICALGFPLAIADPILAFAVACWTGLTLAHSYHPDYIVLESHLFNLIKPLIAGNAPATSQLAVIKRLKASLKLTYHRFEEIAEESNGVSSQLAISALKTGMPHRYEVLEF
ncbi:hypothetical protein U9M48_029627 [Paspalum notatum var. saurae]|uniref:Uncharacterized protein n=1 Tax=Paspalum notatum var. saurae TaxID=547442 RepID=A0AAQ3U1C7_PASNO